MSAQRISDPNSPRPLGHVMTAQQLMYANPRPEARTELLDGNLVVREPAGVWHGALTVRVLDVLLKYLEADRVCRESDSQRGVLVCNDPGFILRRGPDTVRAPDIAYIVGDRWPRDSLGYVEMAPDLVIEVRSPNDRSGYLSAKLADWRDAGCYHIWIIDPQRKSLTVHDHHQTSAFHCGDTSDGCPLFPGLDLEVGTLFR